MKTKFNGILTLLLAFTVHFAFAQKTVSGTVSDDSGPLPGVSVLIKGTSTGTETDFDGKYTMQANEGDIIQFSFVGMETIFKTIGAGNIYNISMKVDASNVLDEVVVTALGISKKKKALGYSTQSVKGESISENKAENITNALTGKIAGLQVKSSSGNIGGSTKVLLRGNSSISGNNSPLYVIDGTPISNQNFNTSGQQVGAGGKDYGNLSSDINPDDVASVNVLKGGAATALYGSRGANGVIMITTKNGSKRQGLGIEFNSNTTFSNVYILPDYQNEYAGGYSQTLAVIDGQKVLQYGADESWGPKMDGTMVRHWDSWLPNDPAYGELRPLVANPNNVRDFYETGTTLTNNLSFSGGTDKSLFRLSVGNTNQKGMMPNSSRAVTNVSVNGSYDFSDHFTAKTSINYIRTNVVGRPTTGYDFSGGRNVVTSFNQWFQRQLDMNRLKNKYKSAQGKPQSWNMLSASNPKPAYWDNPYWILNESYSEDKRNRVYGNFSLNYKINDALSLSAVARTDYYTFDIEDRIASYSLATAQYEQALRVGQEDNFEINANYNKDVTDDISISIGLQANTRINKYQNNRSVTQGGLSVPNWYNLRASKDKLSVTDYAQKGIVNSVAAYGTFGYKNMLFMDWSARNDVSSTLPVKNNSYFYPSLSGSFIFSEVIGSDLLSFGKIRAGWAKIRTDTNPYNLFDTFVAQNSIGDYPAFAYPNTLNNSSLVPELSEEYEAGLEVKLVKNRLGFEVTYYNKVNTDLILPLTVSGTSGVTQAWVNAGKMTNKGWELALNGTPVLTDSFKWNINVNYSKNKNKVVELAEGIDNYLINSWGPSVNARVGEAYGAIVADGFKYDDKGNREVFIDDDGNYLYTRETNKIVGNVSPDFVGGIYQSVSYKSISLDFLVDFQQGGSIYSVSNRYGDYSGLNARTAGLNDKGNPLRDPVADGGGVHVVGVNSDGEVMDGYAEASTYFKHLRTRRENYVYDASYIKLRSASISYTLPKRLLSKTPISNIKLSLVGRNLWLIKSNAPNIDPEATLGSGNTQGFENGQIPSTRSLGFNLNIKL